MKTTKLSFAIMLVASCILFTDCKKKDKTTPVEPDNEQATAQDNALAENTSNDVLSMGSQVSENGSINLRGEDLLTGGCATITSNAAGTVVATQYTIDFGTAGTCTGNDGRVRTGKLFFDFSGSTNDAKYYRNPGFKMVVTSSNYVVDGNQVAVTKTVVNTTTTSVKGQTAYDNVHNLTWSIASNVNIVKANAGGTVSWTCNRTKELINTNSTQCYNGQLQAINWTKAIIKLNGSASGTNAKSESYTAVATDLIRDFTCTPDPLRPHRHPFTSGKIAYTPGNRSTRTIDYGSGSVYPNAACDFNVTVLINGQTYNVTLNQ